MIQKHTNPIVISNLNETIITFGLLSSFYIFIEYLVFQKKQLYYNLIYIIIIYFTHVIYLSLIYIYQTKIKRQNYTKIGNLIIIIQILFTIILISLEIYRFNFISIGILYSTLLFQLFSLLILRLCYSVLKKFSYELVDV